MIRVELDTAGVQAALARLQGAASDLRPLMQEIGEQLAESTKRRFDTSTGPDGERWAPNAESTYVGYLQRFKGSWQKDGRLNARGAARGAAKKPLIGETRSLSTTIGYRADSDFLELGSPMIYAAVQQFGAEADSFSGGKTPWGDVPARPFLGLSSEDAAFVELAAARHLERAVGG